MDYRKEIDGLRAVAVLAVIFFHAGFQTFSGGFIGVDVFFVISGYLITSIIIYEKEAGTFTFSSFYERRARRIIPALFFVMAICLPFAWFWLLPDDMMNFAQSLIAVTTFSSNIFFWKTTGYFDAASELKPLLHTWSLAIEEQYYFIFPALLMLTSRFGRKPMIISLALIAVISLGYTEYISHTKPATAFFLLPTRAWELIAGSLTGLALKFKPEWQLNQTRSEIGSLLGILLITYPIFYFNNKTPTPSLYTLIPIIGACLVIFYTKPSTIACNILSSRILVGIGLISYSAYLWHQPLFAFYRHINISEPDKVALGILSLTSLFFAYLTWNFIERPIRDKEKFKRKTILSITVIGSLILFSLGLTGIYTNGFLNYKLTTEQRLQLQTATASPLREKCHTGGISYLKASEACEYFIGDPTVAIFGDSHTVEIAYALAKNLESSNIKLKHFSFSGCVPSFGKNYEGGLKACSDWTNESAEYISKNNNIKFVIISYRVYAALFGDHSDTYPNFPDKVDEGERMNRWTSYINTLKYFSENGKKVILVLQAPELPKSIKKLIANSKESNKDIHGVSHEWWDKRTEFVKNNISQLPTNITVIDPATDFCNINNCYAVKNNIALYFDDDHMSIHGAEIISAQIKKIITKPNLND